MKNNLPEYNNFDIKRSEDWSGAAPVSNSDNKLFTGQNYQDSTTTVKNKLCHRCPPSEGGHLIYMSQILGVDKLYWFRQFLLFVLYLSEI